MNKKDLSTLAENYEKIFENTMASIAMDGMNDIQNASDNIMNSVGDSSIAPEVQASSIIPLDVSQPDNEHSRMTIANLKSLIAHGQKVLQFAQGNEDLEAWMTDKITVASNDILEICNAIEFRD
jgi:hypothetical protein